MEEQSSPSNFYLGDPSYYVTKHKHFPPSYNIFGNEKKKKLKMNVPESNDDDSNVESSNAILCRTQLMRERKAQKSKEAQDTFDQIQRRNLVFPNDLNDYSRQEGWKATPEYKTQTDIKVEKVKYARQLIGLENKERDVDKCSNVNSYNDLIIIRKENAIKSAENGAKVIHKNAWIPNENAGKSPFSLDARNENQRKTRKELFRKRKESQIESGKRFMPTKGPGIHKGNVSDFTGSGNPWYKTENLQIDAVPKILQHKKKSELLNDPFKARTTSINKQHKNIELTEKITNIPRHWDKNIYKKKNTNMRWTDMIIEFSKDPSTLQQETLDENGKSKIFAPGENDPLYSSFTKNKEFVAPYFLFEQKTSVGENDKDFIQENELAANNRKIILPQRPRSAIVYNQQKINALRKQQVESNPPPTCASTTDDIPDKRGVALAVKTLSFLDNLQLDLEKQIRPQTSIGIRSGIRSGGFQLIS